jgi:hypothetical protein
MDNSTHHSDSNIILQQYPLSRYRYSTISSEGLKSAFTMESPIEQCSHTYKLRKKNPNPVRPTSSLDILDARMASTNTKPQDPLQKEIQDHLNDTAAIKKDPTNPFRYIERSQSYLANGHPELAVWDGRLALLACDIREQENREDMKTHRHWAYLQILRSLEALGDERGILYLFQNSMATTFLAEDAEIQREVARWLQTADRDKVGTLKRKKYPWLKAENVERTAESIDCLKSIFNNASPNDPEDAVNNEEKLHHVPISIKQSTIDSSTATDLGVFIEEDTAADSLILRDDLKTFVTKPEFLDDANLIFLLQYFNNLKDTVPKWDKIRNFLTHSRSVFRWLCPAFGTEDSFTYADHVEGIQDGLADNFDLLQSERPLFDGWHIYNLLWRIEANLLVHRNDGEETATISIGQRLPFFQHSCKPNVKVQYDEENDEVKVWSLRALAKGEESFRSYAEKEVLDLRFAERTPRIEELLGCPCHCKKCLE